MKDIIVTGAGLLAAALLVVCNAPCALAKPQKKSAGSGAENADPLVEAAMKNMESGVVGERHGEIFEDNQDTGTFRRRRF